MSIVRIRLQSILPSFFSDDFFKPVIDPASEEDRLSCRAVCEHIFKPLNMSASTFSVAEAEARGTLADGFHPDAQDFTKGKNGTLKATVPYFLRPGEERTWAGAGGVLTSARDLVFFFL